MTKTILILAIAAAFVAGTITTTGMVYAHGGDVTLIHACVGKTLGIPRIVSPTTTCSKFENPLDWSIQGTKGDKGDKGDQGIPGNPGQDGTPGQACWDLNNNGLGDLPAEDASGDGVVNINDCKGLNGDAGTSGDTTDLELRIDALENAFAKINKDPIVDAGVDQTLTGVIHPAGCFIGICVPETLSCTTTLAGVASDDGLRQPITTTWKFTPGGFGISASFDPSDLNTSLNILAPTTVLAPLLAEFELEVYDGHNTVTDIVQIQCNHP